MKRKRKIYANILCNESGIPFKMIVVDGEHKTEIHISNSQLKTVKKAAYDICGVTDLLVSLIKDK